MTARFGADRETRVGIDGQEFTIDGEPTYAGGVHDGHRIEGLLFNARLVQAIFDDENPETVDRWAYPDTGEWDPERNVSEFVEAMPAWYDHGLRGIAFNLQGGSPEGYSDEQPWTVSAFEADGSLKPDWTDRLERVLDRADELGMVAILGYFYFGQDEVLDDEEAVRTAARNATEWLLDHEYTNVVVEVANECDVSRYDHELLTPERVPELLELVGGIERDGFSYPVGVSFAGGNLPTEEAVEASDVVLLHGNGVDDPARIGQMVEEVRQFEAYEPMPVVFNEDDHFDFDVQMNNCYAALSHHASWGYFDPGENDYEHGYQCPPVEWSINTERKRSFFEYLAEITGEETHA